MGAGTSKQQIGERVKRDKRKLTESGKSVEKVYERVLRVSPETLDGMVKSIETVLQSYSPFPEISLLLAFKVDPERVKKALTECTRKVLAAPIQKHRYDWFMRYVFPSPIWFKKMENGEHLYQEMMKITNLKQEKIIENMDNVYDHLKLHKKWNDVQAINDQTIISRQDDDAVGLLQESGIRDLLEQKDSDDSSQDIEDLKAFIDHNLAINVLMTTARKINGDFQREMKTILSRHGDFKPGPMKKVERALSKLENDYMDEEYPKSAKLLDIIRCSASYNTINQLLDGYNAFMNHIESGVSSIALSRVKNGFINEGDGGYRDIKVNVVYQSTVDPELKMVCEVQFILNQYLHEKKRVHKLYSIAREQTYFDMVAREDLEQQRFEPILNIRDDVAAITSTDFCKCTINSDLGLLAANEATLDGSFYCVNMESKEVVFEHKQYGTFGHHWTTINDQNYLSLQTTKNTINMFRVSDDHQFEEDESMKFALENEDDVISHYEYDQSFDHIYIIRNKNILEKRAVNDNGSVLMSIELEHELGIAAKSMVFSNDATFGVIVTGSNCYFYLIALETQEQFKLESKRLEQTYAPCFINGDSEFAAIGGWICNGVEIWSVQSKEVVHHIKDPGYNYVPTIYSANGILAVGFSGGQDGHLQLYDVTKWAQLYRHELKMVPYSLFLTQDNKYLVTGGLEGESCVVLKIQ